MKIKPLYRFFIWIFLIGLVIVGFLAYYFQYHEKDLFLTALQSSLKQNISASDVDYDFPFGFSLDDFKIEGVIQAKKLSTQFDLRSFKKKQIILSRVIFYEPIITWHKSQPSDQTLTQNNVDNVNQKQSAGSREIASPSTLVIKQIFVKDGRFHFADRSQQQTFSFQLDRLQMKIEEFTFPLTPVTTRFQFAGLLINQKVPLGGSVLKGEGWANLARKDLDGRIFILNANGEAGLSAHAVAKNNDMNVTGRIKAKNLFDYQNPLESTVDNIVLNTLANIGVEIGASFSFDTKLDDFRIEEITFSGSVSTHANTP